MTKRKSSVILLSIVVAGVIGLLLLEALTVADPISNNHITALVRSAFEAEPGVFIWLVFSAGYLCGHFFWYKKG